MSVMGKIISGIVDCIFDLYLFFAAFVFLTAADPLVQGRIADLVSQKPWVHRFGILLITMTALVMWIWKDSRIRAGKSQPTLLLRVLALMKLPAAMWTWMIFITFSVVMIISSCLRHEVFHTSFDMAIFVQAVWNTLHNHLLYSSIKGGICLLGDHFSPLLAVLAIPYAFWTDPKCLLTIQAITVAACVFPIFRIAKSKNLPDAMAVMFVLAFVLYLPVRNSIRFDFHPELLAMPLLLWAFYWMTQDRSLSPSIFLLFSLLAKENVALVTFVIGLYGLLFVKHQKGFGIFWMVSSVIYFYSVIHWGIPYFLKGDYFYLDANFLAWQRIGWPALLKHILQPATVSYLVKIFAPVGFLSFLHPPTFMLTVPMLLQNLVGRNEMLRSIFFQYTALLTPFVFISAIYGASVMKMGRRLAYYLIFMTVLMCGVSEYYVIGTHWKKWSPDFAEIKRLMAAIPQESSVRTHEFYAPHLAHRKEVHIYENDNPAEGGSPKAMNADYVVIHRNMLGDRPDEHFNRLTAKGYQVIEEYKGFRIYKR